MGISGVSEPNEIEHLTDGLNSEFWRHFSENVQREWGPAGLRYQQAVQKAAQSAEAVVELQKVLSAQEAILNLMRWPAERLERLKHQHVANGAGLSRRGPGL